MGVRCIEIAGCAAAVDKALSYEFGGDKNEMALRIVYRIPVS